MLSYKEYKMLNESLYGAINLGIKQPNILTQPVGSTGATEIIEAEKEEGENSIEEAKKCGKMCGKMMKKGMKDDVEEKEEEDDKEEHEEGEEEGLTAAQKKLPEALQKAILKKKNKHKKDHDKKDHDEKDEKDHEEKENDKEDEKDHEEKENGLTAAQKKLPEALQKAILKKKNKKEWSEIVADFESLLEDRDQFTVEQVMNSLENIKKILETKEMTEEEKSWWTSVNSQLAQPGDMGFAPVGKIVQHIR